MARSGFHSCRGQASPPGRRPPTLAAKAVCVHLQAKGRGQQLAGRAVP